MIVNNCDKILDYGANIDEAIINSLHKYYGFKNDESYKQLDFGIQVDYEKFASTKMYRDFKNEYSTFTHNDIIGMMWEPELDFVDDPECYNEHRKKNVPMRFMCGVCLGQFRTRCALHIHFGTFHKGEKLFKCVLCDNIFNELATLKQHRELHNINELVTCGICGLIFTEMYQMIKHKKKYHCKEI